MELTTETETSVAVAVIVEEAAMATGVDVGREVGSTGEPLVDT